MVYLLISDLKMDCRYIGIRVGIESAGEGRYKIHSAVPSLRYLDLFNILLAGDNCLKVTNRNKQGERISAKLYIVSVSCTETLNILCEAPGSFVNRIFLVFHFCMNTFIGGSY